MTINTEAMEAKREAKLIKQRANYLMMKNDPEQWNKIKEGQQRRHERRKAEDPTYMEKQRAAAKAQYYRLKEAGQLMPYQEIKQRSIEKHGVDKKRIAALEYYKKMCESDPEYRSKLNERKKTQYRERKIRECGSEVLFSMCRPGRPRKYAIEPYIISTPSTATPMHSTNVSGDES
jgi:hypothetical protein